MANEEDDSGAPNPSAPGDATSRDRSMLLLKRADVRGFLAFVPVGDLELDAVAFGKALVAVALDVTVMNEDVRVSVLRGDESVSLGLVKPFHRALHAYNFQTDANRT